MHGCDCQRPVAVGGGKKVTMRIYRCVCVVFAEPDRHALSRLAVASTRLAKADLVYRHVIRLSDMKRAVTCRNPIPENSGMFHVPAWCAQIPSAATPAGR